MKRKLFIRLVLTIIVIIAIAVSVVVMKVKVSDIFRFIGMIVFYLLLVSTIIYMLYSAYQNIKYGEVVSALGNILLIILLIVVAIVMSFLMLN